MLKPFGSRRLCTTCLERVSFARSGLRVGTVLRETLWVTKQLVPAIGVYCLFHIAAQLFDSLAMIGIVRLVPAENPGLTMAVLGLGGTLFTMPSLGFVAVCTTERLAGAERYIEHALGATRRALGSLLLLGLIVKAPSLLLGFVEPESKLVFALLQSVTGVLSGLMGFVAFYAPPLIMSERVGALAALRSSLKLVGRAFLVTLLCSLVLRVPLWILQQVPYALLMTGSPTSALLNVGIATLLFPLQFPHAALRSVLLFKLRLPR